MTWWQYAIWGGFGGLAVEFLELYGAIRRTGDWPWRRADGPRPGVLAVSVAIRVGLGMGLAVAAGDTDQISGALGAVAIGVAAPFLLEQMARQVPVREPEPPRVTAALPTITEEPRVHVND